MQTFDEIKYELYEKIENLLNGGEQVVLSVGNKEGTIHYNTFFINTTTDRWHSFLWPKVTNEIYSDSITPLYWGKKFGITKEPVRDYWLRHLEEHFKQIVGYDISELYYSFGNSTDCKNE